MNRTRFKTFTFQPVVNPIYNIFLQFYHHDSRLAKAFPVQSVEFIREKGKISFRKYFSIGWQLTGLVQGGEKEPRLEENRKSREPSYRLRSKPQERARGTREAVTSEETEEEGGCGSRRKALGRTSLLIDLPLRLPP